MPTADALIVATATVREGRLHFGNRRRFDEQVRLLGDGWTMQVEIRRLRATRSLQQSRYYWGVVVELIAEHTGYTPDEVHDFLKAMFIPKRLAVQDGNGVIQGEIVIGGSTRRMNKLAFGDYMESIKRWAAETLDVVIPDPEGGL